MSGQIALSAALAVLVFKPDWKLSSDPTARDAIEGGAFVVFAIALLVSALASSTAMWQTRREQALLRLLPGVPKGAGLNRWLAIRFARQRIAVAAVGLGGLLAVDAWRAVGTGAADELRFALCVSSLSPLFLLSLWRDWSCAEPATAFIAPSDLAVFLYVCGLAACWTTFGDGPWWLLAASSTIALVPCASLRWRGVRSAPPAWPAGRA